MKKIDLPLWSDTVFFFTCAWLITLCIFRYYRLPLWLSLLLCTLCALLAAALFFAFLYRRRKKKFLMGQDREEKEKLMLHLALSDEKSNRALLAPLLAKEEEPSGRKIFLLFCMQPLSADEIANGIKRTGGKSFTVYCNDLSPQARELCERFLIKVTDGVQIYAKLKAENALPEKYVCGEKQKNTFRRRLKISFRKSNSRSFFLSGTALLLLSFFSFFPLYYLISGALLLFAALLIRIFGYA